MAKYYSGRPQAGIYEQSPFSCGQLYCHVCNQPVVTGQVVVDREVHKCGELDYIETVHADCFLSKSEMGQALLTKVTHVAGNIRLGLTGDLEREDAVAMFRLVRMIFGDWNRDEAERLAAEFMAEVQGFHALAIELIRRGLMNRDGSLKSDLDQLRNAAVKYPDFRINGLTIDAYVAQQQA